MSFIEVVTYPVTFIEVALSHDCISAGKGRFDPPEMQMVVFFDEQRIVGFLLGCITHSHILGWLLPALLGWLGFSLTSLGLRFELCRGITF